MKYHNQHSKSGVV